MNHKKVALAVMLSAAVVGLGTACSATTAAPSAAGPNMRAVSATVASTAQAITSSASSSRLPVLGGTAWKSHAHLEGYGQVRPATLFNLDGDPTGLVTHLTWSSWGGKTATGTGTAEYVGPGQSVATGRSDKATVVAFDLGTCNGKKAYQAVEWFFPDHGQHFDSNHYLNACTGENHDLGDPYTAPQPRTPCTPYPGYQRFAEVRSAHNQAGRTTATIVFESCTFVAGTPDDAVTLTPVSKPTALKLAKNALVEVPTNSGQDKVIAASALPAWLNIKPNFAPEFDIRLNAAGEIAALHGLFHP